MENGFDIPTISCPSNNGTVKSSNHIFFECDIAQVFGGWFVTGVISLFLLLHRMSIGGFGSVRGMRPKRSLVV